MSGRQRDRGQAVVELALVLPLVCALLMGVVQVGLVVRSQLAVQVAARAAARAAAVSADATTAAVDGAQGAVRLRPLRVEIALSTLGDARRRNGDTARTAARRHDDDTATEGSSQPNGAGTSGVAVVVATVRYVDPTDVPLIGLFVPSVELRATVTMAVEPP